MEVSSTKIHVYSWATGTWVAPLDVFSLVDQVETGHPRVISNTVWAVSIKRCLYLTGVTFTIELNFDTTQLINHTK